MPRTAHRLSRPLQRLAVTLAVAASTVLAALPAAADEGMWTFDNFPAATVRQRFGTDITPAWLDKVRLATVRLSGCTASFVSGQGLILTNHHCVTQCLAENSDAQRDYLRNGHVARGREEELRCGTQVADVLVGMEDITAKVAAATRGLDDRSAGDVRRRTLTQLEQACEAAAGKQAPRRCETVRLYEGGQYFLYQYKRYSDVRLAFAPEAAIAAFGGDPDNFQFPRWCLDMAFLRAYEDGKPAQIATFRRFDWNGPAENELVFVPGHPGSTDRQLTVAQLESLRASLPFWLLRSAELRGRYIQFAQGGTEQARIVADPLSGLENSIKVRRKQMDALLDPALLEQKRREEADLRQRAGFPAASDPWQQIERALQVEHALEQPYTFIEAGAGFNSALFRYARTLVRAAAERGKPNDQRLREFTDSSLKPLEQRLLAKVPVYNDREALTLSFGFMRMREFLGPDHPLVANLFREDSPEALAAELVAGSQLADPAVRKALWDGGQAAIDASRDPMIRLAKLVDADGRSLRKRYEDEVESVIDAASEKIAAARFKAYGTSVYPDATFTLRLNFGTVQGWNENGTAVAPFTRLGRAFERATGADPFRIPDSWLAVRDKLDMNTPFNLSGNNDIVGGNSGSAMINARGDVVGLLFDGNIHSISGSYWFDTAKNRSVAVHPAIMRTALQQVYGATAIASELGLR